MDSQTQNTNDQNRQVTKKQKDQKMTTCSKQNKKTQNVQNSQTQQNQMPNSQQKVIKAIQINLHGSRVATTSAIGYIETNGLQLGLLQDFHQNKKTKKISGLNYNNWTVTKTKDNRSAIITHLGTNPITIKESTYTTAISLENNKEKITIINTYAPPPRRLILMKYSMRWKK